MPASKAQQKAVNKYVKANYDLFQIKMPKGKKEVIQTAAAGESVNGYINAAIDKRMERDSRARAFKISQRESSRKHPD